MNENIEWADRADNSTGWATGAPTTPDTRTPEEVARDQRSYRRRMRWLKVWSPVKFFLSGFMPRGWHDDDRCC